MHYLLQTEFVNSKFNLYYRNLIGEYQGMNLIIIKRNEINKRI